MNRVLKIRFIKQLSKAVSDAIIESIRAGKVPEDWDGIQLRQLLADKFAHESSNFMSKRDMKEYRNTVLVNNI